MIKKVLLTLSKYSLTKYITYVHVIIYQVSHFMILIRAEKLQLLNLRPTLPVAIQGIIEELEERFDDSEMEEHIENYQ